jgi:ubiquinone/menaquinone biosynthesis C-methylase UbiE
MNQETVQTSPPTMRAMLPHRRARSLTRVFLQEGWKGGCRVALGERRRPVGVLAEAAAPWGDEAYRDAILEHLGAVRDRVLDNAGVSGGETVLDVGCGDGLVGFGALPRVGESGRVIFSDVSEELLETCREIAAGDARCEFAQGSATQLPLADGSVDVATTRSVLIYVAEKERAVAELHRVLRPGGRLSLFEPINSFAYPQPRGRFGWEAYMDSSPNPLAQTLREAVTDALTPEEAERFLAHLRAELEAGRGVDRFAAAYLWAVKR